MSKAGSDTTGTGSIEFPYLTVFKALEVALTGSPATTPVAISVDAGIYVENNVSPFAINTTGISIQGVGELGSIIRPAFINNDLFTITNGNLNLNNLRFEVTSGTSTANCLSISGTYVMNINNCVFNSFNCAINATGANSVTTTLLIQSCSFGLNALSISINGLQCVLTDSQIVASAGLSPGTGTGVLSTGSGTIMYVNSSIINRCTLGFNCTNNSLNYLLGNTFRNNTTHIKAESQSDITINGSSFNNMVAGNTCMLAKDSGTIARLISPFIDGRDTSGNIQGTAVSCTTGSTVDVAGGFIRGCTIGIQAGASDNTDTSTTFARIDDVTFVSNTQDAVQYGLATLDISVCIGDPSKVSLYNSTNCNIGIHNVNTSLDAQGKLSNVETPVLGILNTTSSSFPIVKYYPNLYSSQSYSFYNPVSTNSSISSVSQLDSTIIATTQSLVRASTLNLLSDTSATLGDSTSIRGWTISKLATSATLNFNYINNILSGQPNIPSYSLMSLDGVNKIITYDTNTQLSWSDVSLYRLGTANLYIAGDLTISGLTASTALTTNGSNKLVSSSTTSTELGYLQGTTSSVQTQLNNKLALSGGTLSGTLTLPGGTSTTPQLIFPGGTTGISSGSSNVLDFITASTQRMRISNTGNVSINNTLTLASLSTAGILHNDTSGNITSSLIVNADITDATITTAKLASASASNINSTLVLRDGSGNFATNMITLAGTPTATTDAATKAYVDTIATTGLSVKTPATVVSIANVALTGLQTIDSVLLVDNNRVLLTAQSSTTQNGLWVAHVGAWTRPTDFASGSTAAQAYVLILSGTVYTGSGWICSTPTAIVDTNPIAFNQFSLPQPNATGTNVGSGAGSVYKSASNSNLSFRTILGNSYLITATTANEVSLTINQASTNTASTIVSRDGSGNFSATTITAALTGAASANVLKSGDTMSGILTLPVGSAAAPTLTFTGSTTSGLSMATPNVLSLDISGAEIANISSNGLTIPALSVAGIVHNSAQGLLSTSLIVNADISNSAAIVDSKLATISTSGKVSNSATTATSSNTINAIILRDGSGNFSATTITAALTGAASANVLKAGDTMSGTLTLPVGSAGAPTLTFTGATTAGLFSSSAGVSITTNAIERFTVKSDGTLNIPAFVSAGVVHNSALGLLTTSLIINADIDNAAAITDSKLATISTSGKVSNSATTATSANTASAIVARDVSGNFSAGVITTASLNTTSTTNQLVLGTTNTTTISATAPSASRTYTVKPIAGNGDFAMISTTSSSSIPVSYETVATETTNTIAAADLANGIIVYSDGKTVTLDTGANIAANPALAPFNVVGTVFKVLITSTAGNVTIAGSAGTTIAGGTTITGNTSRLLYFRNTGLNTWSVY